MTIRHYLPKFIAIAVAVVLAATRSCFGTVLFVPQYYQEQDQWCWNASCQMILAFIGCSYSQTEIADWAVGGRNIGNFLFSSTDPTSKGCDEVLMHFGAISSAGSYSAMPLGPLENEMADSAPVMISWEWDSGGGHAVVLCGTEGNSVYVNDPWNGPTVQPYAWVCRPYGQGTWTETLQLCNNGTNDFNELCNYYLYLSDKYYQYWRANQDSPYAFYYLAYSYYYGAFSSYYYWMYYGDASLANSQYEYYLQYALYYYNLWQNQMLYKYYYEAYYSYAADYYSDYEQTGNYLSLAYAYYYYAYSRYYYWIYYDERTKASDEYNHYMELAAYYYNLYLGS